jgi:hypothetical protein
MQWDALAVAHKALLWVKQDMITAASGAVIVRLTALDGGFNAAIVLGRCLSELYAAKRVSVLQCRSTSEVFREDRPSKESLSSGSRPMMCPSS